MNHQMIEKITFTSHSVSSKSFKALATVAPPIVEAFRHFGTVVPLIHALINI